MTVDASVSVDLRTELLRLGTSTLFEAGRSAGAVRALHHAIRPAWPGARMCGPAYPVVCAPGDNFAIHRGLERCDPGSVLIADGRGVMVGYWGEILTVAALIRGVAGFVVTGGVRDIDGLRNRRFPVFATGVGMRGASKSDPGRIGAPAEIGGAEVAPGDIVVADTDGVAVIARAALDDVVAGARRRLAAEEDMIRRLNAGVATMDLFHLREIDPDQWHLRSGAGQATAPESHEDGHHRGE